METWIQKIVNARYTWPLIIPTRIKNLQMDNKYDFEKLIKLKQSINSMEFSCFKPGGKCYEAPKGSVCCCGSCCAHLGHFASDDIIFGKDITTYNKLFFPKTGFWHKHKGCLLPRELRSITCITYNCEKEDQQIIISALRKEHTDLSSRIRLRLSNYLSMHIMRARVRK